MALISIIFGPGFRLLGDLLDAYFTARAIAPIASDGHLAMQRMIRELSEAQKYPCIEEPEEQETISFRSKDDTLVTFYQSTANGPGIFMDQENLNNKLLAYPVKEGSLKFSSKKYGDSSCLISIFFKMRYELSPGDEILWPLFSAIHIHS